MTSKIVVLFCALFSAVPACAQWEGGKPLDEVGVYDAAGRRYGFWSLPISQQYTLYGDFLSGYLLGNTELHDSHGTPRLFFSVYNDSTEQGVTSHLSNRCHLFDSHGQLRAEFTLRSGVMEGPASFFSPAGRQKVTLEMQGGELWGHASITDSHVYHTVNLWFAAGTVVECEFLNRFNKRVMWTDFKLVYYRKRWYNVQPAGSQITKERYFALKALIDKSSDYALQDVAPAIREINQLLALIPESINPKIFIRNNF